MATREEKKNTHKRKVEEKKKRRIENKYTRLRRLRNALPSVYNAPRTYVCLCPISSTCSFHRTISLVRMAATRFTHTLRYPDPHKNVRTRTCYFCSIHWLAMDAERTMPSFAMQWCKGDVTCAPTVLEREERYSRSSKPECQL